MYQEQSVTYLPVRSIWKIVNLFCIFRTKILPCIRCPLEDKSCAYSKVAHHSQMTIARISATLDRLPVAFCTVQIVIPMVALDDFAILSAYFTLNSWSRRRLCLWFWFRIQGRWSFRVQSNVRWNENYRWEDSQCKRNQYCLNYWAFHKNYLRKVCPNNYVSALYWTQLLTPTAADQREPGLPGDPLY